MVVSGLSLFTEASAQVVSKNGVDIDYSPISNGLETQLQWRKNLFALEFEYDEGFEFERSIPFAELPPTSRPAWRHSAGERTSCFWKRCTASTDTPTKRMFTAGGDWRSSICSGDRKDKTAPELMAWFDWLRALTPPT